MRCPACHGTGEVPFSPPDEHLMHVCEACTRFIRAADLMRCPACHGTGEMPFPPPDEHLMHVCEACMGCGITSCCNPDDMPDMAGERKEGPDD